MKATLSGLFLYYSGTINLLPSFSIFISMSRFKKIGPGAIVAAAFIGPGTVTTATLAGSGYGYTLLWAILFSILATFILQEMALRLGVVAQMGVGEALRNKLGIKWLRVTASILVISAIAIGNAAYEAGNISGAALGISPLLPNDVVGKMRISSFLIGCLAGILLFIGSPKILERILMLMVTIMGVVFIAAAIFSGPDIMDVIKGLFIPTLPGKGILVVIGLIGTTVVPYNLFLHASFVKQKWKSIEELRTARMDSYISIAIGGVITMCILIAAAAVKGETSLHSGLPMLSEPLEPLLGGGAPIFIGIGFLAAGLSSAITAPLAAAFATSEVLGWGNSLKSKRFKAVWMTIVVIGIVFASLGFKPTEVIVFAQVANGLLLPIVAIFLVWIMNDQQMFGAFRNSIRSNLLGLIVIVLTIILGIKGIMSVL